MGVFVPLLIPIGIGWFVQWSAVQIKKRRTLKDPVVSRIKLYEEAEAAYRAELEEAQIQERIRLEAEKRQWREAEGARQAALTAEQREREQYWKSLGGIEFERKLGKLYRNQGYDVKSTPAAGDEGIDLILRKDGKTTVVQCKATKRPAVPKVVRELLGSRTAYGANNAILACIGGFTNNAYKYARDNGITPLTASDIARMSRDSAGGTLESQAELIFAQDTERVAKESGEWPQRRPKRPPVCPKHGCGKTMVLKNGRHGRFWSCSNYPTCRGTRNL